MRSFMSIPLPGFPATSAASVPSNRTVRIGIGPLAISQLRPPALGCLLLHALSMAAWAADGSISGTVRDPTGASIQHAQLVLVNEDAKTEFRSDSDGRGYYTFPALPAGHYGLTVRAPGFQTHTKTHLVVDADAALNLDPVLAVGEQSTEVTVTASEAGVSTEVDSVATHLGEVVEAGEIQAAPLNGRSYTDLLAIQPGVSPVTTLRPASVIMAGVTGTINPSGDLNPGDVSISGQRESANGFMVNAIDVEEHMNGGTSVIPNLDSIEELRVLTGNFDAEYGDYNGGMVNVVTKSGNNYFHGDVFEFLRNTDLDARNFFDATRGAFQQNQFGGTLGGRIKKDKVFFFADYQGTRTVEGITSPVTSVPSLEDRQGDLSDVASTLTGTVSGSNTAAILSQRLGYGVSQGEPYYRSGCTSAATCVFPNAVIPQRAWSAPALHLLPYIPTPNIGANLFSTSAFPETVRDSKAGGRIDANTRFGQFYGYYFIDDYSLDDPYPGTGRAGRACPVLTP